MRSGLTLKPVPVPARMLRVLAPARSSCSPGRQTPSSKASGTARTTDSSAAPRVVAGVIVVLAGLWLLRGKIRRGPFAAVAAFVVMLSPGAMARVGGNFDGDPLTPPAEVARLLDSIWHDLNEIPEEYLMPGGKTELISQYKGKILLLEFLFTT